ncbi:hypothetical protein ACA910_021149 [Epithemia clementina (nom. ined.)]
MPFPLMAAASLAALAGNLDCENNTANVVDEDDEKKKKKETKSTNNVRFDEANRINNRRDMGGASSPIRETSLRSFNSSEDNYESSSMFNIITKDGSVHLRRSVRKESNVDPGGKSYCKATPTPQGYIDGSFSSGVTHEIRPGAGCFVLRYSLALLAIGTMDGLELYETRNYTKVFHIPTHDEVSAIQWLQPNMDMGGNDDDDKSSSFPTYLPSQQLLAFGCLDGHCFVYLVDSELLEVEGSVSLLYSCRMDGQVRTVDCCCFCQDGGGTCGGGGSTNTKTSSDPTIVVAFGDKSGRVILISFDYRSLQQLDTVECEHNEAAVLGLSIHQENGWIARCTKHGHVAVYQLQREPPTKISLSISSTVPATAVHFGKCLWETTREGPILAVTFSPNGTHLAVGGYDKTVALIDTSVWATFRKFQMTGTVNVIAMDPFNRYIAVGCRDRSLTLFDSSTHMKIKAFQTSGWVSDISWWKPNVVDLRHGGQDIVAFRSNRHLVSILNLQPIELTNIHLSSRHGLDTALTWSADGRMLIRSHGATVFVVDVDQNFQQVAYATFEAIVIDVIFCKTDDMHDRVAVVDESGNVTLLRLLSEATPTSNGRKTLLLQKEATVMVETGVRTMAWSPDGSIIALGGKHRLLHLMDSSSLARAHESIKLEGRLWDIVFCPSDSIDDEDVYMILALGDYTCIALNKSFEVVLRFLRPSTARCLAIHPRNHDLLVVGDGAGTVAVVNTKAAEVIHEIKAGGGRINALDFSPVGDYLVVGTDDGHFNMYLEGLYQFAQQIPCKGFAICARFSPDGAHLALGSAGGSYAIVRLGPFLGIDLVPLNVPRGNAGLPDWALAEVLYRSGYSESFLQRHIQAGHSDNIRRLSSILKEYPTAVFAFDRSNNETFFDTALRIRRPMILKLAITVLVDGTLEKRVDSSILKTRLPQQARDALVDLIVNMMNPQLVTEILSSVIFVKVPYGQVRSVRHAGTFEKSSPSTADPWGSSLKDNKQDLLRMLLGFSTESDQHEKNLTPAVLPLPGLGNMEFLSALLWKANPDAFDNAAMGVVLRVLWTDHIRIIFYLDFFLCLCFYGCWVALIESNVRIGSWGDSSYKPAKGLAVAVFLLNTVFGVKEMVEARFGRRSSYFRNFWNFADIVSLVFVYAFVAYELLPPTNSENILVPLAVATTFALTIKVISYLRGFVGTGWLISVLSANFTDVRGFMFILFAILVGFAVAFRVLFSQVNEDGFGSLRRSLLSTFELVTTGTYEPSMLYEAEWNVLGALTFVLAVTCVLVIALNALISILADSYARVQENAVANRRREQAGLIVEYMTLLPVKSRMRLEEKTRWFHCLLEVDSDGTLLLGKQDWQGGLNALRKDLEELSNESREQNQKGLLMMKNELYAELSSFRKETLTLLASLSAEMKELKKGQSRGGITLNGRNVVNAVNAVRSIGEKTAKLITKENT